ncbi:hypothetical protein [Paractinoplanes globisporus]|uniref:Uncharacterized protein n=1 Tax=Paractinoplanes globisporus TaxID=113565 RepID=A0ABW6WIB3_9ACTN
MTAAGKEATAAGPATERPATALTPRGNAMETTGEPAPDETPRERWSPTRFAYSFYALAATGAVIGQTRVALRHLDWPPDVPIWARVVAVLPFAFCLELLAMALAAMADERLRLGERAYGLRSFSAAVAIVAAGIQIIGHWPDLYWSSVFGTLSGSAYLLWMLHTAARRRDALRAAAKLASTAPDYGLWRRVRHPLRTARAAELAREGRTDPETGMWRPLGLFESLRAAELLTRDEKRRPAVAAAVAEVIQADQPNLYMAAVAVKTLDLDRLAAELAARVDYDSWADRLAPAITAPSAFPAEASHPPEPASTHPTAANGRAGDAPRQREDHQPTSRPIQAARCGQDRESGGVDVSERPDSWPDPAADLVALLPAARIACDQLLRQGRTISRDALARQMRSNGHTIRNSRVSDILAEFRRGAPMT